MDQENLFQHKAALMSKHPVVAFVFPGAAGHVNPSLPISRALVELGWQVEYVCSTALQSSIEETGAKFHDIDTLCARRGIPSAREMIYKTLEAYEDPGAKMWGLNFGSIATEKLIPIFVEFFQEMSPKLVLYCPVLCPYAHLAALHLKITDVSLLTTAGPGFWDAAFATHGGSASQLCEQIGKNAANTKAIQDIRQLLDMPDLTLNTMEPLISDYYTRLNLVTTLMSLADPLNEKDAQFYRENGKDFTFVGPCLEKPRAVEAEFKQLFEEMGKAKMEKRKIVYVSMGTVLTGDYPQYGWQAGQDGVTGKQLCQAVYRAVFRTFQEALIILSAGREPSEALAEVEMPSNCRVFLKVPQMEILRRGFMDETMGFCCGLI